MERSSGQQPRRRQARGERRIERILDVAAEGFAEVGFEAATTNAIAARARISPGSLYQFFPNKDAIAEALAARFGERLRATQAAAFAPELAALALDEMIDRVVDPLVAFYVAHPGFLALFAGSDLSPRLAAVTEEFHRSVVERAEHILAARAPSLPPDQLRRYARVSVQLVRALLPLIAAAEGAERAAMVVELKAAERGYLAPILGAPTATASTGTTRRQAGRSHEANASGRGGHTLPQS